MGASAIGSFVRIMVVDDDPDTVSCWRAISSAKVSRAIEALSGAQCLRWSAKTMSTSSCST